jgi:hypothetical protein
MFTDGGGGDGNSGVHQYGMRNDGKKRLDLGQMAEQ